MSRLPGNVAPVANDDGRSVPDVTPAVVMVPFSLLDEAFYLLDNEDAPWSIQLEVRVRGVLDESRLQAALEQAIVTHPMARACRVPSRRTAHRETWAIHRATDVDPVRVVDCPDDSALSVARAELQSVAVSLAEPPPLRILLARHPDGDVLMMNVSHVAMDGFGALRVLQSVARVYAGRPDPLPSVGFDEARELPARLAGPEAPRRARRWLALATGFRDLLAPPARLAPSGGTEQAGYGFCQASLSPAMTGTLVDGDRRGTVNDVLLAALHLSIGRWNAEHGARCRRVCVVVPVNLRPLHWRQDVAGNFTLSARVSTGRRIRRNAAAVLDAVTAQTRRKKRSGIGTALLAVLGRSWLLPLWAKRAIVAMLPLIGDRLVDTAMLSNLGSLTDVPEFGTAAGETVEMRFSPQNRMPLGLSMGAVTAKGHLHLSFRYHRRLWSPAAAADFVEIYLSALSELVGLGQ